METKIFFEVYPKRALHEPLAGLVLLDRDRSLKKATQSAREWGACVVRVKARILVNFPLQREILEAEIVYVHRARRRANQERNTLTRKLLMGKISRHIGRKR